MRAQKQKRPAQWPAFSSIFQIFARNLVLPDNRAAPAIVHADGSDVSVLLDVVPAGRNTNPPVEVEIDVSAAQEEVVVFECDRPVRSERDFNAGADRATPAALGAS